MITIYSLTAFVVGTLSVATIIGWLVAEHLDKKYGTKHKKGTDPSR